MLISIYVGGFRSAFGATTMNAAATVTPSTQYPRSLLSKVMVTSYRFGILCDRPIPGGRSIHREAAIDERQAPGDPKRPPLFLRAAKSRLRAQP